MTGQDDPGTEGGDVRRIARAAARRGLTADWARQAAELDPPENRPSWERVAAELDAIEARKRLRVAGPPSEPLR